MGVSPAVEALVNTVGELRALLGKMSLSVATTTLGVSTGNARVLAFGRPMADLTAVPASVKVLTSLGAITHAVVEGLAVGALENNTLLHAILGNLHLTVGAEMTLF